jgi:hypothetical protein
VDTKQREPRYRMGPRVEITTRVRPDIYQGIRQLAEQKGISMTRLVAGLMEEEVMKSADEAKAS